MLFGRDIPTLLVELDALREARGLSYQAVADACNVSKATIYRTLTGTTAPTAQLLQDIAAAVQYVPPSDPTWPAELTKDDYINYLQDQLRKQSEISELRVQQLHAHYNMLRSQDRRTIHVLCIALAILAAAFILWLIIDVTHPTVGWIRR